MSMPEEVIKLIENATKLKVNLNQSFKAANNTADCSKHLGDSHLVENHIDNGFVSVCEYYKNVVTLIRANPSNKDVVSAIKEVFYLDEDEKVNNPDDEVTSTKGYQRFKSIISGQTLNDQVHTIFLVGKRGVGKTFFLNYWMNTETQNMYEAKRIIYRAELSKLYRLNESFIDKKESYYLSVEDYLYLHIVYVTFSHHTEHNIWTEIYTENQKFKDFIYDLIEDSVDVSIIRESFVKLRNKDKEFNPDSFLRRFKKDFEKFAFSEGGKIGKKVLFNIVKQKYPIEAIRIIGQSILYYIRSKKYRSVLIFDGLDNINYSESRDLFGKVINEIKSFCLNNDDEANPYGSFVLVSLRNETYQYITKLKQDRWSTRYLKFHIKHQKIDKILEKKNLVLHDPKSNYFIKFKNAINEGKETYTYNGVNDLKALALTKQLYHNFHETFFNSFIKMYEGLNKHFPVAGTKINTIDDILEIFYAGSIRQFLHNYLNIFKYYILFNTKTELTGNRDYVLREGQLLNGSIHLKSSERPLIGACIPNIFWYDSDKCYTKTWHGLCFYRLLQTINNEEQLKNVIIKNLKKFNYHVDIISECFNIAIVNGFLEGKYKRDLGEIAYELSSKGKYFLIFPFTDINVFYQFALDTPLNGDSRDNSAMIKYHKNIRGQRYWSEYIEACVQTSITLIRHIICQHEIETELPVYSSRYDLPQVFPGILINQMRGMIESLGKNRRDRAISEIKGLVSPEQIAQSY